MSEPGPAPQEIQSEVFAFLADPATHRLDAPVTRIDTHGAAVFLAGPDVYKVKRAICFPFMDFSTLEKRRRACENEIEVNRANAPELYLGTLPISKTGGRLKLGSGPHIIEWAVHLRRFDENCTLDRLALRGALDPGIVPKLADAVIASHQRARTVKDSNSTSALKALLDETAEAFEAAPDVFEAQAAAVFRQRMSIEFDRICPLLRQRETQGWTRRCHGDLHLGNIVLINDAPVLFDAIEFNDAIATGDILYDLAFLLMDLWTRGLRNHANLLFNRYLSQCPEADRQLEGLTVLPFFLALRAAIRAKVLQLGPANSSSLRDASRHYFEAAIAFLTPRRLDLVAVGGLSGSGKTSLARALAPALGRAPGAVHLRSDVERKRMFGRSELERLPSDAYTTNATAETYRILRLKSALALKAGQSVILDAVHGKPAEREAARQIAASAQAGFAGLWLEAPIGQLIDRVFRRTNDASDATRVVVEAQAAADIGEMEWRRLDASGSGEDLVERALTLIEAQEGLSHSGR
ncbi:AAA family ATPase [Methylocapsa palsarum]|uniref:Aminoglycoside phosphotransferase domain-containing protein n=1 Tax=Methylocapsa palsarum TaxID=1612308 RepID=A0A1I3Y6W8_9HYPH|nr:bifunctional aminoglycoside phosphotransferase/ATP-binding protein [Methylocapsa palsarum]SFK27523.1 hypothetical protein SAMN05444581_10548 [Methylocapsa palsarum]